MLMDLLLLSSIEEARKSVRYIRPGEVILDKLIYKLTALATESLERLGKSGAEFVNQLTTSCDRRNGQ